MKKVGIIIAFFAVFLCLYFLQANFFTWFTIADVMPNLFVIFLLFIGLFAGKKVGAICGLVFGIILDFCIGKSVFMYGVMLMVVGFLGGLLDKNFSKDSRITIMLMVIGMTCIFEMGMYLISVLLLSANIEIVAFLRTLLIEIIYNVLLTIIVYPLFPALGYPIEEKFKGKTILTKYF